MLSLPLRSLCTVRRAAGIKNMEFDEDVDRTVTSRAVRCVLQLLKANASLTQLLVLVAS